MRQFHSHPMSLLGLTISLLAVGLALHGVQAGDAKKDQENLQGSWKATKITVAGMDAPEEFIKDITVTVKGNVIVTTLPGDEKQKTQKASFKLDQSKKPKQIDLIAEDGPEKGKKIEGIYELQGDTFKMAIVPPMAGGGGRPKNFDGGADANAVVMTFQRTKKK